MKHRRITATIVFLLMTLVGRLSADMRAAEPAAIPGTPTVDQILERYVHAVGGKTTLQKITSRVLKGTIELPAPIGTLPFQFEAKAPNKRVTSIGGFREGCNGTSAWTFDPKTGITEKQGGELLRAKRDALFDRDIRLKELFPNMAVKGKGKVGPRETYVLEGAPPEGGSPERFYFDVQTGLLLRQDSEVDSRGGKVAVQLYFDDHRDVGGVKTPFTVRSPNPPQASFVIRLTEAKHNVPLADSVFNMPTLWK